MAEVIINKEKFATCGNLADLGEMIPDFDLTDTELNIVKKNDFAGKKYIMNIFPSIDTGTCAKSVQSFADHCLAKNIRVLNISKDLPFAHARFNKEYQTA